MAGPTPVSALIHAATMVTAGVYMVARCSILYALSPVAMEVVAVIGVVTAVFAATIGLVQNDIKKVLAYSTISQLGYMFLAMGVGAFSAGIFHLMTHAFFKALLFLGSGAVIHAMHDEQDIQKMGGLKEYLPITYWTFLIGAIAISGIPPFAGFFSKDEILWKSFSSEQGSWTFWLLGVFGAAMTAFYMFRLVTLTFEGKRRFDHHLHPHEAPKTMTVPLMILAGLSIVGGFVGIPHWSVIEHWLDPVFSPAQYKLMSAEYSVGIMEYLLMAVSVGIAAAGIYVAYWIYLHHIEVAASLQQRYLRVYRVLLNKYYVDEVYDAVIVEPAVKTSEEILWKVVDITLIDGLVNGAAKVVGAIAQTLRKIQTGVAQFYAVVFIGGIFFVITWLLLK
jgi:NADH-quinone oxidoreductase subunit L